MNDVQKIIWAVDPFAEEKDLQRSAAWAIERLTRGHPYVIEPVYFFSAYFSEGPKKIPHPWIHEIKESGQKDLDQILTQVKLQNVKPLHVISEPYLSIRDGIAKLNAIAKRWKADLIVTSTHARKGLKRLFLGSFAETLLLHSDIPLFFINPHWKPLSKFKHILFPTDFSDESRQAFLTVLETANLLKCDLTLFHKLDYVWPPTVALSMGAVPRYSDAFDRELQARQNDALKWAAEAKSKGIRTHIYVDYTLDDSITDSMLTQAKSHPGLIAMAAKSGPTKTAILGSTTRKIVRESPYPVWILHPKLKIDIAEKAA